MIFPAVTLLLTALVAAKADDVPVPPGLQLHCNDDGEDCSLDGDHEIDPDSIIEGDMLEDEEAARNLVKNERRRWPKGVVPFLFHRSVTSEDREKIKEALKEIEEVSCIKFIPWTKKLGVKHYVSVTSDIPRCVAHVGYGGYNTYVGKVNLHSKLCMHKRTIQHEFLHALGFLHEHSRPDRDRYVRIIWDNIQEGQESNFKISKASEYHTLGVPYNYKSLMHYPANAFSKNDEPTIIALDRTRPSDIGTSTSIQSSDIKKLNLLYKCKV